jgi:hypothetical protein
MIPETFIVDDERAVRSATANDFAALGGEADCAALKAAPRRL